MLRIIDHECGKTFVVIDGWIVAYWHNSNWYVV